MRAGPFWSPLDGASTVPGTQVLRYSANEDVTLSPGDTVMTTVFF